MCFSIAIDKNINKLSRFFDAKVLEKNALALQNLITIQNTMDSVAFDQLMGLKHNPKKRSQPFKLPGDDGRIFSNYFTEIMTRENNERVLTPMRYRVRPNGSKEEVPSKYNVFNARIDALEYRQTWNPLFMKNHGIVPFVRFYEWVSENSGKAKLISFAPENREIMWAPVLWDEWISKDGSIGFKSFAIITDGPPPEIKAMGHDRCPIFLENHLIDQWLSPSKLSKNEIYDLLKIKEKVHYNYQWAV
jgi:putative SOS response-associated peptidase YedK